MNRHVRIDERLLVQFLRLATELTARIPKEPNDKVSAKSHCGRMNDWHCDCCSRLGRMRG